MPDGVGGEFGDDEGGGPGRLAAVGQAPLGELFDGQVPGEVGSAFGGGELDGHLSHGGEVR